MNLRKTFKIITHGCRTNIYESEWLRSIFIEEGFVESESERDAGILILNSCCVTHRAERDARKTISKFLKNQNALKILTGCYSRRMSERIWNGKIRIVYDYREIPNIIGIKKKEIEEFHLKHTRFFLKIQEGCDFACSYCIVPRVRGKSRSRKPEEIFSDFEKTLKSGVKEIVLSGTQIGDYGKEFQKDFVWLLKNLLEFKGDYRIRLSSIESIYINEDLVEVLKSPKVCKYFHIPLQSGSDRVLKMMRRPYTTAFFRKKIEYLRSEIPGISLGTDLIAGFPGEEEQDFLKTIEFIKEVGFSHLHVFTFSKRPLTPAEKMEELPPHVKKERTKILIELGKELKKKYFESLIGRSLRVLPEKEKNGFSTGLSDEYVRVYYNGGVINKFIYVKTKEIFKNGLKGEVLCPL